MSPSLSFPYKRTLDRDPCIVHAFTFDYRKPGWITPYILPAVGDFAVEDFAAQKELHSSSPCGNGRFSWEEWLCRGEIGTSSSACIDLHVYRGNWNLLICMHRPPWSCDPACTFVEGALLSEASIRILSRPVGGGQVSPALLSMGHHHGCTESGTNLHALLLFADACLSKQSPMAI
jgi:hypothetical protein